MPQPRSKRVASKAAVTSALRALASLAVVLSVGLAPAQSPVTLVPASTVVGHSAAAVTVTVTMTASGNAASPVALTQGIANLDFAISGGSCTSGASYSVGQQCTATVIFTPKYPGLRLGAVVVPNAAGGVLGEALVSGNSTGSLAVLTPGNITTVAGDAAWVYNGDGQPATSSNIFLPQGVVTDAAGNIFLSDSTNNRIRRVDATTGIISTVAGTGAPGYTGDGGLATSAEVSQPSGITIDGAGNLYFADTGNSVIRRIDAVTGMISTVVGNATQGYTGNGAAASAAELSLPQGVSFDAAGNMYVSDTGNNVVRQVNTSGIITAIAGNGTQGFSGDGGLATSARLNQPWSTLVTNSGALLIADFNNSRIRSVSAGTITTFAGTGTIGFMGDGGQATLAELNAPAALAEDPAGNIYIGDTANNRVREVISSTGIIQTLAGTGSEVYSTADEGQPANKVGLYGPYALYFDQAGNLFIADMFHNRVREISANNTQLTYPDMKEGKISAPISVVIANDGNADLHPQASIFTQSALDAGTTTCATGVALSSDSTCTLGVEFAPTVVASPDTGSLVLPSDAGNTPITIKLTGNVLSVNPTTLALASSANPAAIGSAVSFTATISAPDATTGTVVFSDGATQLCSITLGTSGQATCTSSTLSLGAHTIKAVYSGDTNNASAQSSITQLIQQQDTLTLGGAPNPATVGENVTFSFTATAPSGTPTGTAKFYDGTALLSTQTLSGGAASFSTGTLSVGTHSITVQYSGDNSNAAGTSNVVNEVINSATSTTTLATSNATVLVGTSVSFTATVTGSASQTPTGTVTFKDGATALGSGTLNGSGIAVFSTATLAPGAHIITAVYGGDAHSSSSTSTALTETVNQLTTTTALSTSANPISAGATVQLTATVVIGSGSTADGAITGTVTFTNGATVLGTASVNGSGVATLSTNQLNTGSQAVVATYNGNTNYSTSTSTAVTEVVTQTASSTTAQGTPAAPMAGQTVTVTATVSSPTSPPNGTVTVTLGGTVVGIGTLNASGVVTLSVSTLPVGTDVLTVSYAGNANYSASSNTVTVQVSAATTQTALLSSANPQSLGQPVTLTATVTSTDAGITGSVSFLDGATSLGTATVNGSGIATLSTSALAFGSHTITAVYSGDTNHATSTSGAITERIVQAATAVLTSSANPAVSGQAVTFTVKITGAASTTPTGNVTFTDGGVTLGTAALDATGTAFVSSSTLAVGTHPIAVTYPGDTNYSNAQASLTETVQNASTQVSLVASANPAIYGTAVTLTATVSSNGTPASGTVTFTDGTVTIGTGTLNASGVAVMSTSALTPGVHSIVANYGGSGSTGASVSTALALKVEQMTQVVLVSSENPANTLDTVTLTAAVTNAGQGIPTGTVTFTDGASNLGTASVGANGTAVLTGVTFTAGNHSLVASYSGDATDLPATSAQLVEGVTLRPTTTTLTATNANPADPQAATLIAVIRWTGLGSTIPTGSVTFTSGSLTLGTAAVDSTGVATLDVELQSTSQTIVATYAGDTNYATSTSIATSVAGGAATQFTLGVTPAQVSIPTGQHTVVNVTLNSIKSFSDTLELGCLGLPEYATCTFSNVVPQLTANGTVTVQLTVDTGNPLGSGGTTTSSSLRKPGIGAGSEGSGNSTVAFAILPAGLLFGFGLYKRRRLGALLVLLFAVAVSFGVTGCSGLHQNTTPVGTYTFKVTASGKGTGATQSQTVTLTVTN
ncbi:Ig-like domain repeat protein [Bryocella elongata]|nr:Ig-like domain repeat protein [Bryocella elongata]